MIKLTLLLSLQYDGKSALMLASEKGHTEIVKHLVEAKASLDLQSRVSWPSNPYFYIALCSRVIKKKQKFVFFIGPTSHFIP